MIPAGLITSTETLKIKNMKSKTIMQPSQAKLDNSLNEYLQNIKAEDIITISFATVIWLDAICYSVNIISK